MLHTRLRPSRARLLNRVILALAIVVLWLTAAVTFGAAIARATPNCETVKWGFLGSQLRTICDGPTQPDGSWQRTRVITTPAHRTAFQCYGSSFYTACAGGDYVEERVNDRQVYPVTAATVLPDEPGHLA